jgi:hypothetical protein
VSGKGASPLAGMVLALVVTNSEATALLAALAEIINIAVFQPH